MTDRHVAETYLQEVETHEGTDYLEREIFCGEWRYGARVLCDVHLKEAQKEYPQGWNYYPGDVCQHGVYVGGCGPDLMCFNCEMGYDIWHADPMYALEFRVEGDTWLPASRHWRESIIDQAIPTVERWAGTFAQAMGPGIALCEFRVVQKDSGYWDES